MADAEIAFGQQRDVLSRYVVFFQCFTNNALTVTVRVEIGLKNHQLGYCGHDGIELVILPSWRLTVSQVFMPLLYACSSTGSDCSSSITQASHLEFPNAIVPSIILDILRPEAPNLLRQESVCAPRDFEIHTGHIPLPLTLILACSKAISTQKFFLWFNCYNYRIYAGVAYAESRDLLRNIFGRFAAFYGTFATHSQLFSIDM